MAFVTFYGIGTVVTLVGAIFSVVTLAKKEKGSQGRSVTLCSNNETIACIEKLKAIDAIKHACNGIKDDDITRRLMGVNFDHAVLRETVAFDVKGFLRNKTNRNSINADM